MSNLQEKPSALKRENPTHQNIKFLNFFLLLWAFFALLDPDPESGSGFTGLIESASIPDPKHWQFVDFLKKFARPPLMVNIYPGGYFL
jgi:hypothetical protein